MYNEHKLDELLLELGHNDFNRGTAMLRTAVRDYRPGIYITKELYPGVAAYHGTTPARVERNIRHSIESAWNRSTFDVQTKYFGNSVDPNKGAPTVGEYVARLARIVHEADV